MTTRRKLLWGLCLLILAVISVRYVWRLAGSEVEWRHRLQGEMLLAGLSVGIQQHSLGEQPPRDQAQYWLKQVVRMKETANDPQLALGAAWMLDTPQGYFYGRHLRKSSFGNLPGVSPWTLDYDQIEALHEEFETLCRDKCLRQIRIATELDGMNVEVWRARALLLFQPRSAGLYLNPRQANWLAELDECARHDPGNALYDYLACLCLWTTSATHDQTDEVPQLLIKDPQGYRDGSARLQSGLAKPFLSFGTKCYVATQSVLDRVFLSPKEKFQALCTRDSGNRAVGMQFQLVRWLWVHSKIAHAEGDFEKETSIAHSMMRFSDQMAKSENDTDTLLTGLSLRGSGLNNLKWLYKVLPERVLAGERQKIKGELDRNRLEIKLRPMASKNLYFPNDKSDEKDHISATFLMMTAKMLAVLAMGMALLMGLLSWLFGKTADEAPVPMGWFRHVLAWTVGLGISVLVFGIPASWIVWEVAGNPEYQGFTAKDEEAWLRKIVSIWGLIWLNWQANRGPLIGVCLAVLILSSWHLWRRSRLVEGGFRELFWSRQRSQIRLAGRLIMKSCLVAALLFFILNMIIEPTIPRKQRKSYALQSKPLTDPQGAWEEMDIEIARLRSDKSVMEPILKELAEQNERDDQPE